MVASALTAAPTRSGRRVHMSERFHPWQEWSDLKLEPQPADSGGDTNTKTLDAAMLVGTQKATATPSPARTACTSLLAYQNLPSSPNLLASPSRAAGLYARPISRTALLHALSAPCH